MRPSKQLFGYHCCDVEDYMVSIEEKRRQNSSENLARCEEQFKSNVEKRKRNQELVSQLDQYRLREQEIMNRLLEQVSALQEAYYRGQEIVDREMTKAREQIIRIEGKNRLLQQLSSQMGD